MEQNTAKNTAGLKEPWKKGETGNPNGRPKGQRNYATIYREALEKIAASQNKTPEEIENMMTEAGIKHSIKGNQKFYAYIMDKVHGKTPERHVVDMTIQEPSEKVKNLAKRLNGIG